MTAQGLIPDHRTYVQSHIRLAAICMAGALLVLWLLGDENLWVGPLAAMGAIGLRGWYLHSEEMAAIWRIDPDALVGPQDRHVPFAQIETVRTLGSVVQVITRSGDKHLIKYQADPAAVKARIEALAGLGR